MAYGQNAPSCDPLNLLDPTEVVHSTLGTVEMHMLIQFSGKHTVEILVHLVQTLSENKVYMMVYLPISLLPTPICENQLNSTSWIQLKTVFQVPLHATSGRSTNWLIMHMLNTAFWITFKFPPCVLKISYSLFRFLTEPNQNLKYSSIYFLLCKRCTLHTPSTHFYHPYI